MADFKKNPKSPHIIKIPNKIRKHFGMASRKLDSSPSPPHVAGSRVRGSQPILKKAKKDKSKLNWFERWVFGWIQIVSGFFRVITFGFVEFDFCFAYLRWLSHKKYDYRKC